MRNWGDNINSVAVNILGTEYKIITKPRESDKRLDGVDGYCDGYQKLIVVSDMAEYKTDPKETIDITRKQIIRHEIIHAFLDESGLNYNANVCGSAWSKNEEMVDWIAWQFPKIYKAYEEIRVL